MKRLIKIIIPLFCLVSCLSQLSTEPDLYDDFEFIDFPPDSLSYSAKTKMNGVFIVKEGNKLLGDSVVGKWVNNRWCLYAKHDVVYAETAGGRYGDSIKLTGYVRTVRYGSGTRIKLNILSTDGAKELLSGTAPSKLIISGTTKEGLSIRLSRSRPIYSSPPIIVAHRGGCRNTERIGISENSIAMIEHAEILGATGIEIDVKRTSDDQLIIFHDDTFSPRTVQGAYLLGAVENFSLRQIQMYGRLIYGEPIPTLEEALSAVIEKTNLSLVWLDIKDPKTVNSVIMAQRIAMNKARVKNRSVEILLGIPTNDVLKAYRESGELQNSTVNILIEFDSDSACAFSACKVWGPRWTKDISTGGHNVHAKNKKVIPWTVDLNEAIINLTQQGIDGVLTNYASLAAGLHYSK